jgi:hypothetical protein
VVDGHWNVLLANRPSEALFGAGLVGGNLVRMFVANPAAADRVVNWPQVASAGLGRLRRQRDGTPFDDELGELVALAETAVTGLPRPATPGPEPLICPWFRVGNQVVRTLGMAVRFDPVAEVTLDELRIELIYPLDDDAEDFFRNLASATG